MKTTACCKLILPIILFILCLTATIAAAYEAPSAVPPVIVLSDTGGDYVADEPFPQWVRETHSDSSESSVSPCLPPGGMIPGWAKPLPSEPVRCVALNKDKTELWAATPRGAIFFDLSGRRKLFFAGKRWLPDDDVISIGVTPAGDALAHTAAGDSLIARRMMTLEQKALLFDRIMQERHNRTGFIGDAYLRAPGDVSTAFLTDDDNDGQWTEMYLAAESFRYAATHDPEALRNARDSFRAMETLLTVSPIKGFPARSVLPPDKCPGGEPENWRMLLDGSRCWKGDTSVDELVGHYFGLPIYYDLAADAEDREKIKTLIRNLTDFIIGNGFRLVENGRTTSHGHLDPEWVNSFGRFGDQGLYSLQALNALRAAYHITGDKKYLDQYHDLIKKYHYHRNALRQKEISDRFQINHDSDEMAFLSFYNLLRYEDDPVLREKYYLEGLRRSWKKDLPERNPEQVVIYGAFAKKGFRLDLAARTLREIPLDLIKWSVSNGARGDAAARKSPDRLGQKQGFFVLPYTETPTIRWSENMYRLEENTGGRAEAFAIFWLLPHWMARYHGMIRR